MPAGHVDEVCFNLGVKEGKRVALEDVFSCDDSFRYSFKQAMNGKVHSSSLNACNNAGYSYGQAKLRVSARNGEVRAVGQDCIDAYNRGRAIARANSVITLGSDSKVNACLEAGYYDEGWL